MSDRGVKFFSEKRRFLFLDSAGESFPTEKKAEKSVGLFSVE